jgi:hypothetical protein
MSITSLTPSQLRQAADLKEKIAGLEKQLAAITGTNTAPVKPTKKGGMSAAGKARISAAAKLRWAKIKAAKLKPAAKAVVKPVAAKPAKKKGMSAAAKAKLSALMKARWAAKKAKK